MINLPIYRAKKIDSDEYVEGYFVKATNLRQLMDEDEPTFVYKIVDSWELICEEIDPTTLAISFDGGKSFLKLSDLEIHTCTDFELKYTNMKMRNCKEVQPPNGNIFTVITDKGR